MVSVGDNIVYIEKKESRREGTTLRDAMRDPAHSGACVMCICSLYAIREVGREEAESVRVEVMGSEFLDEDVVVYCVESFRQVDVDSKSRDFVVFVCFDFAEDRLDSHSGVRVGSESIGIRG